MVVNIAAGLQEQGKSDITVLSILGKSDSYYSQKLKEMGIPLLHLFPDAQKAYNPKITTKLYKILKLISPDVVHTHLWGASLHGYICAKLLKIPIVVHEHNVLFNRKWYWDFFDRVTFRSRSRTIACSLPVYLSLVETLKLNSKQKKTLVIINNCINEKEFAVSKDRLSVRKELGLAENDFVFINVASLTEQKGHRYLIEAFSLVVKEYHNAKLLIAGDGILKNDITMHIEKHKLSSNVILLGIRKDVADLLNASDIFILPSLWEGLPMVLLEAMYRKLPAIVSNVGIMKTLVTDHVNGLLADPMDTAKLHEHMKFFITNTLEKIKMGCEAEKIVTKSFLINVYIDSLTGIYRQIL